MTAFPSNGKVCANCVYSHSTRVIDPVPPSVRIPKELQGAECERVETKCHIQGKPRVVNAETDWCFAYWPKMKEKDESI